jgi:hypothetical protein
VQRIEPTLLINLGKFAPVTVEFLIDPGEEVALQIVIDNAENNQRQNSEQKSVKDGKS